MLLCLTETPHELIWDRTRVSAVNTGYDHPSGVRKTSNYVILLSRLLNTAKWLQFLPRTSEVPLRISLQLAILTGSAWISQSLQAGADPVRVSYTREGRSLIKQIPVHRRQFILILPTICKRGAVPCHLPQSAIDWSAGWSLAPKNLPQLPRDCTQYVQDKGFVIHNCQFLTFLLNSFPMTTHYQQQFTV